jgi:exopolysaccharide biosynthesis protein
MINIFNSVWRSKTVVYLWIAMSTVACKQRDDYPVFEEPKPPVVEEDIIPPDNSIGPLTQLIIDKTDIIKTFQLDSTVKLADGVERTHVRFLNKLNQAMSMQILEVDLSKPNLTAYAMSPFDEVIYSTQTMDEMAKYNEPRSGGKIIAAINGDVAASGAPAGSFIKLGRQIKTTTTTATANTRAFFAVKKDGTPFIGNRPSSSYPLDSYNLDEIAHLVSGGIWLLYNNDLINSTVTTVQANTGIGITQSKKVFAVVVDGVNNKFSVGITYNDLGKIMKAIGCYRAFSTSVGTSAVMVQRYETNDPLKPLEWRAVNKPATPTGGVNVNGIGFVLK